jgi:hypothetical protein
MASRRRKPLDPGRMAEIAHYATAPRATMTMRCGHQAHVPDYTDPTKEDCWVCSKTFATPVGFAKEPNGEQ